jgi:hypothetical protein
MCQWPTRRGPVDGRGKHDWAAVTHLTPELAPRLLLSADVRSSLWPPRILRTCACGSDFNSATSPTSLSVSVTFHKRRHSTGPP